MSIEELEQRFHALVDKFNAGALSREEFQREIAQLRFRDAQNHWWMIGAQTGKWYTYDGARWIAGQPPAESAASLSTSMWSRKVVAPATEAAPAQPVAATPSAKTSAAPAPVMRQAMPAFLLLERLQRIFRTPSSLHLLIIVECIGLVVIASTLFVLMGTGDNSGAREPVTSPRASVAPHSSSGTGTTITVPMAAPPVAPDKDITSAMTAGDQLVLQGQLDSAIAQYQTAAQLAPSNPAPLVQWSRVLGFRGQMHDALAKAHQAVQRAPEDAAAQAQLARALAWSGVNEDNDPMPEALAAGEKAVELDPKSSNAHAYLAEVYLLVKRPADAEKQARAALELAPQSAEAHRSLAWVLTLAGQKDAALTEWRQTVALEPQLFFRHFELGEVLRLFFHDPGNAAAEYQTAASLYSAYEPSYIGLGLAYLDAHQPQNALAQFQHAATLAPEDDDNAAYLGLALGQADRCSAAIPYFKSALGKNANNAIAAKGLAECENGKKPSAPVFATPTRPLLPPSVDPKLDE